MARLPALIQAYADATGRDHGAIANLARMARGAGLIAESRRGMGATAMTETDAVNLLLADLSGASPQDMAKTVQRFRSMPPTGRDRDRRNWEEVKASKSPSDIARFAIGKKLGEATNFGEALETLVTKAPGIAGVLSELAKAENPELPDRRAADLAMSCVTVSVRGHGSATIQVTRFPLPQSEGDNLGLYYRDFAQPVAPFPHVTRVGDRVSEVRVGLRTILALHFAIFDDAA